MADVTDRQWLLFSLLMGASSAGLLVAVAFVVFSGRVRLLVLGVAAVVAVLEPIAIYRSKDYERRPASGVDVN